jgi:hypothetical protein
MRSSRVPAREGRAAHRGRRTGLLRQDLLILLVGLLVVALMVAGFVTSARAADQDQGVQGVQGCAAEPRPGAGGREVPAEGAGRSC